MTSGGSKVEFREPQTEARAAGYLTYKRVKSPYELYMEEEGIPIFRGMGVRDTRDLPPGMCMALTRVG